MNENEYENQDFYQSDELTNTSQYNEVEENYEVQEQIQDDMNDNSNIEDSQQEYEEEEVYYTNAWAIASLVFSAGSLIAWLIPYLGFATSIIGLILGAISVKYSKPSLTKLSITLSLIGFFITLIYSLASVILFIM